MTTTHTRPDRGDVIDALDNPAAIFVYGTLLVGEPNHNWIRRYVRSAHDATVADFALYGARSGFPYGVLLDGASTRGQVLTFAPADFGEALRACDQIEGYPEHYDRKIVVALLDDGTLHPAWVYFVDRGHVGGMERVPGDDWRSSAARAARWFR